MVGHFGPGTNGDQSEATRRSESALRLLRAGGYLVRSVHYGNGSFECLATRYDDLGVPSTYVIGVADHTFDQASVVALEHRARREGASLLIVADDPPADMPGLRWSDFVGRMGGEVPNLLPLEEDYRSRLIELGRGHRPTELPEGSVAELYETYVHAGLEFLIGARAVRYGATRRFRPVPDGLLLPSVERVAILYDAKAYDPAYEVTRDDVRRFSDYARRYNEQYGQHAGPARSFLVVSTAFAQSPESRLAYSHQLQADVGVPMAFLTSETLATAVEVLATRPWMRTSLRWREILGPLDVTSDRLQEAIAEGEADGVRANRGNLP